MVDQTVGTARFLRRDFLGAPEIPLADAVRQRIKEETGKDHAGPIYLLANWRYFGYQNNPIAVYYCYDAAGEQLQYVVAEVTNTPGVSATATCSKRLMPTSLWQQSSRKRSTSRLSIP